MKAICVDNTVVDYTDSVGDQSKDIVSGKK